MPKFLLKAVVAICGALWLGKLHLSRELQGVPLLTLAGPFTLVAAAADLLLLVYDRWLWAWVSSLVNRPDLRGTWQGTLMSEWVDPRTGKAPGPIKVYACITQTASTIHLRQYTKESGSLTVTAALTPQADNVLTFLALYQNEPKAEVRFRSEIHFGSFRLQVAGDHLAGTYWTDRNTRGHMELRFVCREKCHSFDHAFKLAAASSATLALSRQ